MLLADEVGLGKTIEAGMVLKEYLLRGMAERADRLTPRLAGRAVAGGDGDQVRHPVRHQLRHLLRTDPERFWAQPRVIASMAAGRRKEHRALLGTSRLRPGHRR